MVINGMFVKIVACHVMIMSHAVKSLIVCRAKGNRAKLFSVDGLKSEFHGLDEVYLGRNATYLKNQACDEIFRSFLRYGSCKVCRTTRQQKRDEMLVFEICQRYATHVDA